MEGFLKMLQSTDPYFPTGAFTLSNGLETYVQKGIVHDFKTMREYALSFLENASYNELAFMYHACRCKTDEEIIRLDALSAASRSAAEVRRGMKRMCASFLRLHEGIGTGGALMRYKAMIDSGRCIGSYPVALGIYCSQTGADVRRALVMYGYSLLSALAVNGVKLIPLGQSDGQRVIAESLGAVEAAVKTAMETDYEELGISGGGFELRAVQHEGLYTRLYMS